LVKGKKTFFFLERFLKLFCRHGLQLKYLAKLNKSILYFYFYFYFFRTETAATHGNYLKNAFIFVDYDLFFYFESILSWLIFLLEPVFITSIKKVEKKFRKKFKKKFTHEYIYVFPKKRTNLVLKNLINFNKLFSNHDLPSRLGKSFLFTFLDYKNSTLYKKKIFTYQQLLQRKQNYSII
jgi:hypothetical protein